MDFFIRLNIKFLRCMIQNSIIASVHRRFDIVQLYFSFSIKRHVLCLLTRINEISDDCEFMSPDCFDRRPRPCYLAR